MRDETYDYIWNEIILDNINDLFGQYSDEEKIRFGIRVKSLSEEEQLFQYSLKEKLLGKILLSNAYLAYNVGIGLIRMNLIVSYLKLGR